RRDGLRAGGVDRGQGLPGPVRRVVGQLRLFGTKAVLVINFRYHVVSLTAVFLALAIGLVVGTAALNGPVADSLKNQISALNKDNSNKRDQINQYREELNRSQDFATEIAPSYLNNALAGRKILVVVLPNTSEFADGVISML